MAVLLISEVTSEFSNRNLYLCTRNIAKRQQNKYKMKEFPITLAALVIVTRGWERFKQKISLDDAKKLIYEGICCKQFGSLKESPTDESGFSQIDTKKLIADLKKNGGFSWI